MVLFIYVHQYFVAESITFLLSGVISVQPQWNSQCINQSFKFYPQFCVYEPELKLKKEAACYEAASFFLFGKKCDTTFY